MLNKWIHRAHRFATLIVSNIGVSFLIAVMGAGTLFVATLVAYLLLAFYADLISVFGAPAICTLSAAFLSLIIVICVSMSITDYKQKYKGKDDADNTPAARGDGGDDVHD